MIISNHQLRVVQTSRSSKNLKFVFIEPVGGSAPKFSGVAHLTGLIGSKDQSVTLTCPAQGSPIPSFRSVGHFYFHY